MNTSLPRAQHANLHFVTPSLAIGGDLHVNALRATEQLAEIHTLGITHVVDCRIEWDDEELFARELPDIGYLHHGMDDAGQRVPATWFEEAVTWVDAAGEDAVVLTHCHMGINRGPSLGFAVLLHQGWDPIEAMTALRTARPQANVWYAADALRWHHGRQDTNPYDNLALLEIWRLLNPLDVVRLIREQREDDRA